MRVTYEWEDGGGDTYTFQAEVHPLDHNRITIVSACSADDVDIDFDDFDENEKVDIRWAAKRAAQELDNSEDPLEEDENEDDESNFDNY